ncbi:hypothetical protein [Flavobacterium proteolyticum]|uniref:Outer membrane protein beta-barrel domain-containing protein n=1 Tax=Flavobacterium proteolyticum TaxID=2911683 RepID=A0ABR9WMR7_9FLAO|nr:hypothetical protein [Flavobacterium proteolyticum]MBE9575210.1 hypothetical protein [Flavobacterium proteolyticum]
MKKIGLLFLAYFLFNLSFAQEKESNLSVKFNLGTSFSKPAGDLGNVAGKGKSMQLLLQTEVGYHLSYNKSTKFGVKLAGVAGQDWANFLSNDALTELKVSVPNLKARIYPLSFQGDVFKGLEKIMPKNLPFAIELPIGIALVSSISSLHFDYGLGFGKITETAYIDEYDFNDQTVNRTMRYFGWGFQPQIYRSDSEKWIVNAMFDFGKYSWTNANGGTSSFKTSQVGFGAQYNF